MLFIGSKVIRDGGKLFEVTKVDHWSTVIAEDGEEFRIKNYGPNDYASAGNIGQGFTEPKYVALEGLKHGNRFCTSFSNRGMHERTPLEELSDGTVAYKVIGYFVTLKDAQAFLTSNPGGLRI
jgi:hypothetical protein